MQLQAKLDTLRQEIESLRQRLDNAVDEPAGFPRGDEAIKETHKLDQLIAEFLRVRERLTEAR